MLALSAQLALPIDPSVLGLREWWPIGFVCCFMVIALPFWAWMIVECITKESKEGNDRLLWLLVILIAHWIGALIYFFVRRPARIRELGR